MIYNLAPGGRMGMVLANGSLSSQSGGEGEIRKNIVNADLVDCIIILLLSHPSIHATCGLP